MARNMATASLGRTTTITTKGCSRTAGSTAWACSRRPCFEGEFRAGGLLHGYGRETLPSGCAEGQWNKGRMRGLGKTASTAGDPRFNGKATNGTGSASRLPAPPPAACFTRAVSLRRGPLWALSFASLLKLYIHTPQTTQRVYQQSLARKKMFACM